MNDLPPASSEGPAGSVVADDQVVSIDIARLMSNLLLEIDRHELVVVYVAAATRGEGTTTIARALAVAAARWASCKVALINATGEPRNDGGAWGLLDALPDAGNWPFRQTTLDGVVVMEAALAGSATGIPTIATMRTLLGRLRQQFSVVIIDGPPVLASPQMTALSAATDGVVLVVEAERTRTRDVERSQAILAQLGVPLMGAILNKRRDWLPRAAAPRAVAAPEPIEQYAPWPVAKRRRFDGLSAPARQSRYAALDSWRGVCALLVAMFHFMGGGHFFTWPFVRSAYLFVDFFFVLSGFVMTHVYADRLHTARQAWQFARKRIARVWPLHVVVLFALILVETLELLAVHKADGGALGATFSGAYALSSLLPNILLIHSFGIFGGLSWNIPSWSISSEMGAYAVFAALCLTFQSRLVVAAAVVCAGSALSLAALSPTYMDVTGGLGLCRCLFGFFLGTLIYRLHRQWTTDRAWSFVGLSVAEVTAVVATICFVSGAKRDWASLLAPFVFAWVVFLFSFEAGIVSRWLRLRPFTTLGLISYSIYMVHYPIFTVLRKITLWCQGHFGIPLTFEVPHWNGEDAPMVVLTYGNQWVMDAAALAFLATCVGVGLLTYRYIEMPGQRLLTSRSKPIAPALAPTLSNTELSVGD